MVAVMLQERGLRAAPAQSENHEEEMQEEPGVRPEDEGPGDGAADQVAPRFCDGAKKGEAPILRGIDPLALRQSADKHADHQGGDAINRIPEMLADQAG